jgi:hypothetical protein
VRLLLVNFARRFDAYPDALETLRRWRPSDVGTRPLICHWHLQLSDPLYRRFTGEWLQLRRAENRLTFTLDSVSRWVGSFSGARWAPSTQFQFARKLVRAADEAGLVSVSRKDEPRTVLTPHVSDEALGYVLRVLHPLGLHAPLSESPYLSSVGLTPELADARFRRLPDVTYRRMGELVELEAPPLGAGP